MATVEFRYDPKNTAWFTANAAMVLKAGEPAYHDTTGLFKLGDGVTALSALSFLPTVSASTPTIQQVLTAGQVATTTIETTGFIKTGGLSTQFLKADGTVDSTVYGVGNALTTNPLSQFAATTSSQLAGVISDETGTGALVFGTSPTFTTSIITPNVTGVSGNLTLTNAIQSSGAITQFTFTNVAHTNQTATTNIPNFRISGANKQWATGTVPLQYFNHLTANTVSAVGASTFTNVYGLYVEAATAGTNATITNNWAIGTNGDIQIGGNQIVFNAASNAYLRNTAGNLRLSCGIGARVAIDANGSLVGSFTSALTSITTTTLNLTGTTTIAGDTTINSAAGSSLTVTSAVRNAGVRTLFTLIGSADINQTTGTEVNRILWTAGSKTWATGNITNQREFLITSPTYNFNGTSTITNAYNAYFEAPIAGTNATITNNYAAGFDGNIHQLNNGTNGIKFIPLVGGATYSAIYMNQATPSGINYTLACGGSDTYIRGTASLSLVTNQTIINISTTQIATTDGINYSFGTTNGTKIATATTQKLSFWNATPIVQPTTAVAASALISNLGTPLTSTDTFDGYTLQQMVKALRDTGLLA